MSTETVTNQEVTINGDVHMSTGELLVGTMGSFAAFRVIEEGPFRGFTSEMVYDVTEGGMSIYDAKLKALRDIDEEQNRLASLRASFLGLPHAITIE